MDRYIIGWQSEVELTEAVCSKRVTLSSGGYILNHFKLFVSRAGCGVCTVLVHCKDTRRELLLQGGMRWAMGESVETQAVLAEHLRYVIQCEIGCW